MKLTDSNGTFSCGGVVGVVVEPNKVADPVSVGVAGDDNVVADVVVVEGLEGAIAVGLISWSSMSDSLP